MRKFIKNILSDPVGRPSFILTIAAIAFLYGTIMEGWEFTYTHTFHIREYLDGCAAFIASIGAVHVAHYGFKKYSERPEGGENHNV